MCLARIPSSRKNSYVVAFHWGICGWYHCGWYHHTDGNDLTNDNGNDTNERTVKGEVSEIPNLKQNPDPISTQEDELEVKQEAPESDDLFIKWEPKIKYQELVSI